MIEWFQQLQEMLHSDNRLVLITVVSVKGSTPREAGAKMLVSVNRVCNTIGGGHLEYRAIQIARNMLSDDIPAASGMPGDLQRFTLGAGLGQCCGGVATLFFEVVSQQSGWLNDVRKLLLQQVDFVQVIALSNTAENTRVMVTDETVIPISFESVAITNVARSMLKKSENTDIIRVQGVDYVFDPIKYTDFTIYLFGAGHVGEALVRQLAEQPCTVNWVDSRDGQLPEKNPSNVMAINTDLPEAVIDDAPAGSYFLVMTHDHSLDLKLAEQILKRDDYHYFGLIGSVTKRKKFEHRLGDRGINKKLLQKMTCPIGIRGINSKRPAAIALAVMAELIQCYEQALKNKKNHIQQSVSRDFLQL